MKTLTSVILAAGAGTRMKSKTPKVVHKVCGKPMVEHVIDVLEAVDCTHNVAVVGHGKDIVQQALNHRTVDYVVQEDQLGTAHAVMMAEAHLPEEGDVLILCGDTPLLTEEAVGGLIDFHRQGGYQGSLMTTHVEDPAGYGRILRGPEGQVVGIVEHKDATDDQRVINEINPAVYIFDAKLLKDALQRIGNDNAQGEFYLPDVVGIFSQDGRALGGYAVEDYEQMLGINSRRQLAEAELIMRKRIVEKHMDNGVTFIDPNHVTIEKHVTIGCDTVVYSGTLLTGETSIGEDCVIGPDARIENGSIGNGVEVRNSTILNSSVGDETTVGPYAYIRPGSNVGARCKIGDFVEVKNSTLGNGSKVSHLAYIGDGDVGENVNIGCGAVFVNYDGTNKHRTTVEDGAFVGCNVNLVAPVTVEKGAYVAAGSTVTMNVPADGLGVARARQRNIEGWVTRRNKSKNPK